MSLYVSSTVVLIIRSKLYYTTSGIITLCRWPSGAQIESGLCAPDGHLQNVTIPDAVQYNFDLMMSTTVLETCTGI